MSRVLRVLASTFALSASLTLVYRANILFYIAIQIARIGGQFLTVAAGYDFAGGEISGWTRDQAMLLTAVNALSEQMFSCFFINSLFNVTPGVWTGKFDFVLLKPLHPLLSMVAAGRFSVASMPNLVIAMGPIIYFARSAEHLQDFWTYGLLVVLVLVGVAVRVAIGLLCMATMFFSERMAHAEESYWAVNSLTRYQMEIYPGWLRHIFTYALPLSAIAYVPVSVLTGSYSGRTVTTSLAVCLLFVFGAAKVFLSCVRRYKSVNSG